MTKASVAAKEHAIQTKGLSGTTDTFVAKQKVVQTELEATATSSKLSSVGVKALSTAFNMFAGMAIMWGITKIIEGFEYLSESAKSAKEKLSEIQTELNDNNSTYQSNRSTLVGLKEEYDALTKKAETLGGVQNLANDEYERYQAITSQILGITPKLTTGWNEEGEAISNKNNLLQASIDLLDEEYEKSLRNNTTKSKNEDVASGVIAKLDEFNNSVDTTTKSSTMADMRESFLDELEKLETELGMTEHDIVEKMWVYFDPKADPNDFLSDHVGTYEELRDLIAKDYDKLGNSFVDENNPIYELFSDEVIDDMIRNADAYFDEGQRILNDREALYQDYKDQLSWNAQATQDKSGNNVYQQLTDNGKAFINEYIEGLDYASIKTEEDFVEMANDIQKFTKLLASNEYVSKLIESIFTPATENETSVQYVERVQKAIADVQQYCKDNYIDLPINFTTLDDVNRMTESVQAFLSDEFDNKVGELSLEDLQIASEKLEIEHGTLLTWDELITKIKEYKKSLKDADKTDNLSGKTLEQIWNLKGFEETKDKLKELATSGELSPKVLSDTEEYKTLIDELGISADKAYHKIQKLTLKDINDDIGSYTALLGKIRKGQSLSAKEASSFINKNASLAGSLVKVGNGYSFEENAIVQLLNTSIEAKNVIISSQIATTQTTIKQVNNRIKAYKTELKALVETLKKQAQAYETVVELQSNTGIYLPSDAYGDYTKNTKRQKELEDLIEKAEKNQKKNKKRLQSLQKELSNLEKTSSGNASSSNSGSSSSSSSSSKQQFDWIEKRLDHLANKTQKTIDKINNYVSQRTKKGLYKTLLNNIQDEIDANDKATKKYSQKANSVKLSSSLKQKLRTGAIKGNTKSLIQEYGEETAEKMEKYLNWYEKSQNAKQTAREKRQELLDKKREALDSQINYDNDKLNRLKTMADKYQYNIGLAEAKGLEPSKKSYTNLIKNSKDQISNLKDQNTELKEYQKGLKKGSDEWYDIQQQIDDNNASIQDLTKSQVEWNAEIRRIPLKIVQSMADLLESVKNSVQSLIDLRKQLNKYASLSDVKKEITLKRQDTYYKTREMQELTRGDLNEALTNEGLNNTQKQQYIKYLEQLAKGDITEGKFFELIGKLGISKSDYNRNTLLKDTTNSILDDYSTILSNTSEIDQLAEGYLDTQISKLQEQRDLLNEINDAKSKAIELEKKQQALQEAKQNKTNLIYHEGFGFSYEADQSAINDAQRDLDDYNFELDQEQFDKAINILEEIRDNKSYVELRENGDTFFPNIDQWVGSIVKSLSSANISLNFSLDKDGNISTSPKLAKGTKYAKGGMSIVGENGIEMRLLNQGDAILPHDVTENLWEFGLNPQQMIMDNLNIKIPDYSNLIEPKTTVTSKVVNIQNVTLPNINDLSKAQELFDGLITINSDAQQRAWKR